MKQTSNISSGVSCPFCHTTPFKVKHSTLWIEGEVISEVVEGIPVINLEGVKEVEALTLLCEKCGACVKSHGRPWGHRGRLPDVGYEGDTPTTKKPLMSQESLVSALQALSGDDLKKLVEEV